MNSSTFRSSPAGYLTPTITGYFAFVPNPLPPAGLDLSPLLADLASASQSVGELNGIGRTVPNPYLLIRSLQRREAISSSTIEGTFTTMSDLLLLEAGATRIERPQDTREVLNYV